MSEQNNLFFTGRLSFANTAPSALTQKTIASFDGPIYPIRLCPGKIGPFYRVDEKPFSPDPAEFQKYAIYSRVESLKKKFLKESIDKRNFEIFLHANQEEIEMDAGFNLLKETLKFFESEQHAEVEKAFKKTSRSRWLGLTKPASFKEADGWYDLGHLKDKSVTYLYELYFDVPADILNLQPFLFAGKVKSGTSLQFKMNNHAVECVSEIKQIEEWNMD